VNILEVKRAFQKKNGLKKKYREKENKFVLFFLYGEQNFPNGVLDVFQEKQ